jgi:hypothetical protein
MKNILTVHKSVYYAYFFEECLLLKFLVNYKKIERERKCNILSNIKLNTKQETGQIVG